MEAAPDSRRRSSVRSVSGRSGCCARHLHKLTSRGYEFELDMLIECKQLGVAIVQTIQTVYLDGNASSHFNPLLDSMRVYFAPVCDS
jgi:hypothetical protein